MPIYRFFLAVLAAFSFTASTAFSALCPVFNNAEEVKAFLAKIPVVEDIDTNGMDEVAFSFNDREWTLTKLDYLSLEPTIIKETDYKETVHSVRRAMQRVLTIKTDAINFVKRTIDRSGPSPKFHCSYKAFYEKDATIVPFTLTTVVKWQ